MFGQIYEHFDFHKEKPKKFDKITYLSNYLYFILQNKLKNKNR